MVKIEMPRRSASRNQLPDEVANYVRNQILSGELRPGRFVRMEPIAEAVGVSITPVREGLVVLSSEGFVTWEPRRGFMVAEVTREDVRDLFWAQSQLAGELAARAAVRITDSELERLHGIQDRCVSALEASDVVAIGQLGPEFHRVINRSARSARLARLLQSIVNHLPSEFYASLETHADTSATAHGPIYEAIVRRDAEIAERLMRRHLLAGGDIVVRMLEERGLWKNSEGAA
ncbi:GntR family transcriptional regulator [Arthrobacter bambusae]|uniref:GntR family transcriptional regulator n=1 Tax=Arthrobacter bambusae TaxID=1338426 RepID=UPI001F5063EA|nr:GntR family transcriptional regulator [Arthrobacter bambusae]MCI0142600.1 GntR family transcriptional regulator [Arthrobacter bambusae]